MINYEETEVINGTENTLKELLKMFLYHPKDIAKAMKKHKRESDLIAYLKDLLPF